MASRILRLLLTFAVPSAMAVCQATSFSISEIGAIGDGKTLNTAAIQNTVDMCAQRGGGTVIVPAGVFVTGTIQLRSNINLCLEPGGVLKGSTNLDDYRLQGKLVGMLFTRNAANVAISGQGTLDGNGDAFMDLSTAKKIDTSGSQWTRQGRRFRYVKQGLGDGPVVPGPRPNQMIIFSNCRSVTVRDIMIVNSPFWTLHCADCDGVMIRGIRIWCNLMIPNNDGIDLTSCSNAVIAECDIRTGDDAIVLTGYDHHYDLPGFNNLAHPSENICVANCTLVSRSSAIRIGGYDQNSMRNYTFTNITIDDSNRGIGIFARDRGSIENMVFSNIIIHTRLHTGDWWGNGEPIHLSAVRLLNDVLPGHIRNVKFQNITCESEAGILLYGTGESVLDQVSFDNVSLHIKESPLNNVAGGNIDLRPALDPENLLFSHDLPGLYARYVKDLRIRDFDLRWDAVKEPFFTNGVEIESFNGVTINGFLGTPSPGDPGGHAIVLRDGKGANVDGKETYPIEAREK